MCICSKYKTNVFPGVAICFGDIRFPLTLHRLSSLSFPHTLSLRTDWEREAWSLLKLKHQDWTWFYVNAVLASETRMIFIDRLALLYLNTKRHSETQENNLDSTSPLDSDVSNQWAELKTHSSEQARDWEDGTITTVHTHNSKPQILLIRTIINTQNEMKILQKQPTVTRQFTH